MGGATNEIDLYGFDPEGEPVIRVMSDGTLYLILAFMPPSDSYEDEHAQFDDENFFEELQRAVGVEVVWEDRERFYFPKPAADTMESIREFMGRYGRYR